MAVTNQLSALFEPKLQAWLQSEHVSAGTHDLLQMTHPDKSMTFIIVPKTHSALLANNVTLPDLILRYPSLTMSLAEAIKYEC